MKAIAIILAVSAGALMLAGCATSGADTQPRHCYRTVHKTPYRVSAPCKTTNVTDQRTSEQPAQPSSGQTV